MLFNSYQFILVFLPVVLLGAFLIGRLSQAFAVIWLALASLIFYGSWNIHFVPLLLISIIFNYTSALYITRNQTKRPNHRIAKIALVFNIVTNFAALCYYKYFNFFAHEANQILGLETESWNIILPLGISFFTFTQVAFVVDVYQGKVKEYKFHNYLLFVTYFPHLIAGPILHHKQMMPQFDHRDTFTPQWDNIAAGITIFILGLSKKVLIADELSDYVKIVFDMAEAGHTPTVFEAWVGSLAYTFQLYFDFSGYSDMAIGLSLLFNVRLPLNFDSPYKAQNIIDFWRRWHMTLSAFLRDYLYIPLGGNRHGEFRRHTNLMVTMILGGLWHGAGWTFVAWGCLHGTYLVINHVWRNLCIKKPALSRIPGGGTLTFFAVLVAWVVFRAESFQAALLILNSMAGNADLIPSDWIPTRETLKAVLLCSLLVWFFPNTREYMQKTMPTWDDKYGQLNNQRKLKSNLLNWTPNLFNAIMAAGLLILCIDQLSKVSPFLYFTF